MDAAYDTPEIIEHSRNLGHVPLVDKNPCSGSSRKTFTFSLKNVLRTIPQRIFFIEIM